MLKILLVEDNEMNRDMLSRRLQDRGFEIVIAVDGQEGVNKAGSELPGLILMDMSLPVIDGWEATRRIKANPATKAIPVIALTAHALSGNREKAFEAGCDEFDTKPVRLNSLLPKIEKLTGIKAVEPDYAAPAPAPEPVAPSPATQPAPPASAAPASAAAEAATVLSHFRHDLCTPINQIIGYGELLGDHMRRAGQAQYQQDLGRILAAAETLLGMITRNVVADRLAVIGQIEALAPAASAAGLILPADPAALDESATGTADPASAPDAARCGHILVVDDSPENCDVLRRQLERRGHTVAVAHDGHHALERLRAAPHDLVLLDMLMPGLDGHGTLVAIKADPALHHLPVIMVSALGELASVVRCIESGADDYLTKPVNPILLSARINAGLERKRFRDQEKSYIRTIEETQRRLNAELAEAEKYVRSILPAPGPTRDLATAWLFQPSTELGGDSFGHHWIDDDHLAVYLLDVVGHGLAAALVSVTAINIVRSMSLPGVDFRDPGATLTALNAAFLMENQGDMYFTIWYGVWEASTRTLKFASAGHPPSLLRHRPLGSKPGSIEALRGAGVILGGMPGTKYRTFEKMIPGPARLYLISDGVFEITRPDGSMWDQAGLQEFLDAQPFEATEADLADLLQHARALNGPGPLDDDFSVLRLDL